MTYWQGAESLHVRLATDAARYSAQCDGCAAVNLACGARGPAGEIVNSPRPTEADGQGSTRRTLKDRKRIEGEFWLLRNPLAASRKQRSYGRENSLSRIPPYRPFPTRPSASGTATKGRGTRSQSPRPARRGNHRSVSPSAILLS